MCNEGQLKVLVFEDKRCLICKLPVYFLGRELHIRSCNGVTTVRKQLISTPTAMSTLTFQGHSGVFFFGFQAVAYILPSTVGTRNIYEACTTATKASLRLCSFNCIDKGRSICPKPLGPML